MRTGILIVVGMILLFLGDTPIHAVCGTIFIAAGFICSKLSDLKRH